MWNQVDLAPVCKDEDAVGGGEPDDPLLHCITFTLLSGGCPSFFSPSSGSNSSPPCLEHPPSLLATSSMQSECNRIVAVIIKALAWKRASLLNKIGGGFKMLEVNSCSLFSSRDCLMPVFLPDCAVVDGAVVSFCTFVVALLSTYRLLTYEYKSSCV